MQRLGTNAHVAMTLEFHKQSTHSLTLFRSIPGPGGKKKTCHPNVGVSFYLEFSRVRRIPNSPLRGLPSQKSRVKPTPRSLLVNLHQCLSRSRPKKKKQQKRGASRATLNGDSFTQAKVSSSKAYSDESSGSDVEPQLVSTSVTNLPGTAYIQDTVQTLKKKTPQIQS